jgi:hypothetical protein
MLWHRKTYYQPWPFDKEIELEAALNEVKVAVFGEQRI